MIRTIYFYTNIHLHNNSSVACREKSSRLLLSDELKMYLWESLRYRVGIVAGWVMPLTRLREKFAVRITATARKKYLIINSEEKLFRKGISICVKPARAPTTWILWLYLGLYVSAQEPAHQVTKLQCWRRSSIAFSNYINIKTKMHFRQNWRWGVQSQHAMHFTPLHSSAEKVA